MIRDLNELHPHTWASGRQQNFLCCCATCKGKWVGRIAYADVVGIELHTNLSFRNKANQEHYLFKSPFCELDIDMVNKFPIDNYMHHVCLGLIKKLHLLWVRGKHKVRISAGQVVEISDRLVGLKRFKPSVLARKPRGLHER